MSLAIIGLIVDCLGLFVSAYLAFIALQFTAKPRIKVLFKGENGTGRESFEPSEHISLAFEASNIGYWYAKPAALETLFYFNFEPQFDLLKLSSATSIERIEEQVRVGKGGYKYLAIDGVQLFADEPSEILIVEVITPPSPGLYPIRVTSTSLNGDHKVSFFQLKVLPRKKYPQPGARQ